MTRRNIASRIRYLLLASDVEPMRFFIAVSSLLWALMLIWPGETFGRQTYAIMAQIAPEHVWAAAHLLHGVSSLYSLFTGFKGRLIWGLDPVLGCLLWTSSSVAMVLSVTPVPAAIAPQIVGAVAAWWLLVRYQGSPRG